MRFMGHHFEPLTLSNLIEVNLLHLVFGMIVRTIHVLPFLPLVKVPLPNIFQMLTTPLKLTLSILLQILHDL
jgi:hypothetical protein